jgi:Arc/MetJ-type ribon-helix-helix transcriptional regulator
MTHALQVHLPAEFEDKLRSAIGQGVRPSNSNALQFATGGQLVLIGC